MLGATPKSRTRLVALVLATLLAACGSSRDLAVIEMESGGEIWIELHPELAPETVANFKRLARSGFYDGTTFHLVIPGEMIQGGDPNTKNDNPADDGFGGPGYTIPDEFNDAKHVRGAVAMSHPNRRNSAGSQFYIMQADTGPNGESWSEILDGKYTIFGNVVSGMSVVDRIANTPKMTPADLELPTSEEVDEALAERPSAPPAASPHAKPPADPIPFLEYRPRTPQTIATIRIADPGGPVPPPDTSSDASPDPTRGASPDSARAPTASEPSPET